MSQIPVDGESGLVRDKASNAILSCDRKAFEHFRKTKREKQQMTDRVLSLETQVKQLQEMIEKLLNK